MGTFTTIFRISSKHRAIGSLSRYSEVIICKIEMALFFVTRVLFVLVVHLLSTCHTILDVEFCERVVSDHKGDGFGYSLATSYHKLVIGAPWDDNRRGSVIVDKGVRVKGPEGLQWFGWHVDVNQQFMVVIGQDQSVYVHQSNSPYDMVARFPLDDGYVYDLVISDDNTIAVSHYDKYVHAYWLTIYHYDGSSTWNMAKNFKLESYGAALAVYGDILVVGLPRRDEGHIHIFNRVGGEWVQGQTIKQKYVDVGYSVAINGQHMAVSAHDGVVFTYIFDQRTNTWIGNGKHSVPGKRSFVSIRNELLVVTVNDMQNHPDLCGVVYNLMATPTSNNNNNKNNNGSVIATTSNNNNNNSIWKEFARLTTKGDPMRNHQHHLAVSIKGSIIFTGRHDERGEGVGKVFVHELPKYYNGQN